MKLFIPMDRYHLQHHNWLEVRVNQFGFKVITPEDEEITIEIINGFRSKCAKLAPGNKQTLVSYR